MTTTVSTLYYSDTYGRTDAETQSAAPTLPTIDASRAQRAARTLPVLDGSRSAVRSALLTLNLCQTVPVWPDAILTTPAQAQALRALAALTRDHTAPGAPCPCDDDDRSSAHNLAKEWLHLWRLAVRYVEDPGTYGWELVTRAALVTHDCAAFASTGDPADILGPASTPPSRHDTPATAHPGTTTAAPGQLVRAAGHPAYPPELANRSPWFG